MAMAARRQRGMLDPDAAPGESLFDHHVYCLASDGDLQEGVSAEASSLAGHQQLGNLTLIWDDNQISIEDDTDVAFTEDVALRYEAYGWHVQTVDWAGDRADTDAYREDVQALYDALEAARAVTDRPSFIKLRTIIAWPAPTARGTGAAHGSALGADEVAATKELLGFDPARTFEVPDEVLAHTRKAAGARQGGRRGLGRAVRRLGRGQPGAAPPCCTGSRSVVCPTAGPTSLPTWEADAKGVATRKASGEVINAVAGVLPELWGGSADLAGSNNTTIKGSPSFNPVARTTATWKGEPVRPGAPLRHPRARHGRDHERHHAARRHPRLRRHVPAVRRLHAPGRPPGRDDAGAGDLRLDPRLDRSRRGRPDPPAGRAPRRAARDPGPGRRPPRGRQRDRGGLEGRPGEHRPPGGPLPDPAGRPGASPRRRSTASHWGAPTDVAKGAYVLLDAEGGQPDVVLIATGSEVQLAVEARATLAEQGVARPRRLDAVP